MANRNGENYAKSQSVPVTKNLPGEVYGDLHVIREVKTLATVLAEGEYILGPILPKGAIVIDAYLKHAALTSGEINLGHLLSADGSTHALDVDAFVAAVDPSSAGMTRASTGAGIGVRFTDDVQLAVYCSTVLGAAGKIEFVVQYVRD